MRKKRDEAPGSLQILALLAFAFPMLDERMDHFYGWILQGLAISYFIGLMLDTNNQ